MKTIGITGGIGSGKSVVSHLLKVFGYPVYDSDSEAKRLMDTHPDIREKITALFGRDIYRGGQLDRLSLARHIFGDQLLLKKVNAIVHPVVRADFKSWCFRQNKSFVFMESAILFESEFEDTVDEIWMVSAPEEIRIFRVMERNSCTEEEVRKRMSVQMDDNEKCTKADRIILNDDKTPLIPQIQNYLTYR